MLYFYLAFLVICMFSLAKILGPEMAKPTPQTTPKSKAKAKPVPQVEEPVGRVEKLEYLLAEKNKNISLLQSELKVFLAQVREFDKIKTLQEEEIHRLREQNRIFRSELGLSTRQVKENIVSKV